MLLSTQTDAMQELFGPVEAVRRLAACGFDAYDFSMFHIKDPGSALGGEGYSALCREIRAAADGASIVCNQSHAPFPSYKKGDDAYNARISDLLVRALEIIALLGGKICVVHPCNDFSPGENAEQIYLPLLPHCRRLGVKVALENMWNWPPGSPCATECACSTADSFLAHLDALDPDLFVACLDVGHAEMFPLSAGAPRMIRALGPRLQALHIHDNDLCRDLHTAPYLGKIDFDAAISALSEIGYAGDLTFEADAFLFGLPEPLRPAGAAFLARIGRHLMRELRTRPPAQG